MTNAEPSANQLTPPAMSAVITGGSRGIGFGIAELLTRRGWALTLTARHADQLAQASDQLTAMGGTVQVVAGDMADDAALADVLGRHEQTFGAMSALVLAAGVGSGGDIAGYPISRVDKQFAVNIRAPYSLASQALPMLRRSAASTPGGRSWVVAIASIDGVFPPRGLAAYSASKAALISLVHSINIEENENGVLATAISPAFVATELSAWTTDTVPFDEMLTIDDVVKVVDLILSMSPNALMPHIVLKRVGAGPYNP
jgi:3-oxoacyl-[acyl-carrier protein] reductase